MGRNIGVFLLFLFLGVVSCKDYFRAASFEHRTRTGINEKDTISENLKYYKKAASIAAANGADIILFNEYGLIPFKEDREHLRNYPEHIPDPRKKSFNPCLENTVDRVILHGLSCIARKNKMYVVGNLLDIQPCEEVCDAHSVDNCAKKCPDDGLLYNTDVAFDREGNLIARYHKYHLYFEPLNVNDEPDFATFETEFGKFGMIVCFDSVFHEAVLLAREHGIDTLLFPTYWFDDIVPLNAVEFQQSWALANKVNFISANTQTPGLGSLGSGIYSKDNGALVYTYNPDGESKLLMANLKIKGTADIPTNPTLLVIKENDDEPKIETGDHFPEECTYEKTKGLGYPFNDLYETYRCFKSQTEHYTLVKLEKPAGSVEACHNGFCCSISYSAEEMKEDYYLAVHNGTNNVKKYFYWGEETCLLVRCNPEGGKPCVMHPSLSKTVFKSVEMRAGFSTDIVYATVSKNKYRLAPKQEWNYERKGSESTLHFQSTSNEPLLKVGMMGRCYERDPAFIQFYQY